MKKNYLLLFFIALLFGIGTLPGRALEFSKIDPTVGYVMKIGSGFLFIENGGTKKIGCVNDQSQATKLAFSPSQSEPDLIESISAKTYSGALKYMNTGSIKQNGFFLKFKYSLEGGKYYLKAAQGTKTTGKYLTYKSGVLSFESAASSDAVIEIVNPNGASATEVTLNAKKMRATLALFQAHRVGIDHSPNGFFGTGVGQYPVPTVADFDYATYHIYLEGHADIGNGNAASEMERMERFKDALKLNLPKSGTFVVVTTKSQFEDAVRANAKTFRTKVDIDAVAGTSQPAQYLMASATGYKLTDDKSKAAVFYFDGHYLTGIDNGFGLGTPSYTQTEKSESRYRAR